MRAIESNIFKNPLVELIARKLVKQKQQMKSPQVRSSARRESNPSNALYPRTPRLSEFKINFKSTYEFALMCQSVYEEADSIMAMYGSSTVVGSVSKVFPFYGTVNHDTRKQYVVLGSRQWLAPRTLKKDYMYWTQLPAMTTGDIYAWYKLSGI
jgi:hypothetical protein